MILPTLEQIIITHKLSIMRFGGEGGFLNKDGLFGFIDNLRNAIHLGKKDVIATATWIFVRLIQNHYFIDGNKRIGLATFLAFLKMNDCSWKRKLSNGEMHKLVISIASAQEEILEHIEEKLREIIIC